MKQLSKKDQERYGRFLDSWLIIWSKNSKDGTYRDLWSVFRQMKDQGIENDLEFKQLGGFGLHLLNVILYSFQEYGEEDIREEGEPHLIECVIALHLLTKYLREEFKIQKIRQVGTSILYREKNIAFEKNIFSLLPTKFHGHFKKQINSNKSNYWQTISEMRTMALFYKLGMSPKAVDVKTVKDKNVDFVSEYDGEKIYVEVKGLEPENYQTAKRPGSFGAGEEDVERALRRSQDKFFENSCNIVVVVDEETYKTPLFVNPLLKHNNTPLTCLLGYEKTGALIILGGLHEDQFLQFMIWYNPNAQKDLPQGLKRIFDQNKVRKNGRREN